MVDKTKAYNRRVPLKVRAYQTFMATLSYLFPHYAAERAYFMWFQSPRYPEPSREKSWRSTASMAEVQTNTHKVMTYHWRSHISSHDEKSAPTVVLLHGWSGRATQMGAFVQPLLDAGFDVVAFDAPGHGRSSGNQTNFFEIDEALTVVCKHIDHVAGIVAHSFGVLVTAYALRHSVHADRAVLISSPTDIMYLVSRFCQAIKLTEKACRYFQLKLEKRFDTSIWTILSADENARRLNTPALIIHDKDDRDVPVQLSQRLANAWSGSEVFYSRGLGHRRILRNNDVIQRAVEFLQK